ncbi:MAG: biotin--[acetyl-CoA-carboxylase] ligase [Rhodospirillaceae bacterium]|nr:biotin--[acetyl-CoA-carboxylase] ligase [Rhodospirillaceae bacterium]
MSHARITVSADPLAVHLPRGWRLMRLAEADSTNAVLRRLVETGAEAHEGLVVWAEWQTAGRGRAGRDWVGAPGNLYMSLLVAAPMIDSAPAARAAELGFIAGLAVVEAIQTLAPARAPDNLLACKWPNDVLFDGAKVAGILLESLTAPSGEALVVVGIGINAHPVDVPKALYPVTSLAEREIRVNAPRLLEAVVHAFAARLAHWRRDGFAPVRAEWLRRAAGLGQLVTVDLPGGPVTGRFADLDTDGALVLDGTDGARRRVLAGDLLPPPRR